MNAVFIQHGQPMTNTQKIASALKVKHAKVIEMIERLFVDYPDLRVPRRNPKTNPFSEVFEPYETEYRGQRFNAYLLNEQAFTLLLPRFETQRAKQAFREFNQRFYHMKQTLLQAKANQDNQLFQQLRIDGKATRKSLTDTLKAFATYATDQGSKGAGHIYTNTTKAIYSRLGIEVNTAPSARDALDTNTLAQLEELENDVADTISAGMLAGEHYKEIKADVKNLLDGEYLK